MKELLVEPESVAKDTPATAWSFRVPDGRWILLNSSTARTAIAAYEKIRRDGYVAVEMIRI